MTRGGTRIRVAMISPSLRGGGLERLVHDLALNLPREQYETAVFCTGGLGVYAESLRKEGIQVWDCTEPRIRLRGIPTRLIARLRSFGPDVIHAHSGTWLPATVARSVLRSPRLVFTDHGRYPPESRGRALVQRWCERRTDCLVSVSSPLSEYLRLFLELPAPPEVVPNGIDLTRYEPDDGKARARLRHEWGLADSDVVAVSIGRLAPVKNHSALLRALALAAPDSSAFRLVIVGKGALESELRREIEALRIADRVTFAGYRDDIADCLRASDLFVISSTTEGLPVSLLEALASGVPVVSTAVGGIPEVLGSPCAGILTEPGDVAGLSDAMRRLATQPGLRCELSKLGRVRANDYSMEAFTTRYSEIYSEVLHTGTG